MHRIADLRPLLAALAFAAAALVAGCSEDVPITEPEGAWDAFSIALFAGDADGVWDLLAADTHARFAAAWDDLQEMDEMLRYLQASERAEVRRAAGLHMLDTLEGPEDLFAWMFVGTSVPRGDRHLDGAAVAEFVVDGDRCQVETRAGQQFELVREEDGVWRVAAPLDAMFASRLERIATNREHLRDTVTLFGTGADVRDELRRYGLLEPDDAAEGEAPAAP